MVFEKGAEYDSVDGGSPRRRFQLICTVNDPRVQVCAAMLVANEKLINWH
jgi:hypothetical protein